MSKSLVPLISPYSVRILLEMPYSSGRMLASKIAYSARNSAGRISGYPSPPSPNLVPRVFRLFGQRGNAGKSSRRCPAVQKAWTLWVRDWPSPLFFLHITPCACKLKDAIGNDRGVWGPGLQKIESKFGKLLGKIISGLNSERKWL